MGQPKTINYNVYISVMPNVIISDHYILEDSVLKKSTKYFTKSKSLSEKIILSLKYPNLIQNLEEFLTEVLENSIHLQNLEIDKTLPQSKQKSQAKSILQRKRRGLADLFKALSKIGLSYKKGVLESNLKEDLQKFVMKPIDLELLLKTEDKSYSNVNETILKHWSHSESYYLKSSIHLDVLQNALIAPSKDLGVHEIERCKGFPINLMSNILDQKQKLIDSANDLEQLRNHLTYFKQFCKAEHFVKRDNLNNLTEALKKAIIILEEYKIILNTCPDKNDFEINLNDVPLLKDGKDVLCYKNEDVWNNITLLLNRVLAKIENTFTVDIAKEIGINDDINLRLLPINNLNDLEASIKDIEEMLINLLNNFGDIPLSESLEWISNTISDCREMLISTDQDEDCENNFDEFKKRNEEFFRNVLFSIQNLFKQSETLQSKDNITEENERDMLQVNHLNILTKEGILESLALLNTKEILKQAVEIKDDLQNVSPNDYAAFKEIIKYSLPLLDQFLFLYQFLFAQQTASYRTSSKMNYILLNIFTDLITKGFCIPPEFSDELSTEGTSQQSSGMGLGDGEGEKDVSDKIESEDQLEEAKPDGEENNQNDDKDCKEEEGGIEMSEDFESKLQDVERKDDEDEKNGDSDDDNSDHEEQMGETETGADQLDKEVWGSDNEEDEKPKEEEKGSGGENLNEEQIGAKENGSEENESGNRQPQDMPLDKELNEEFDDEQTDPYHQNQHEMQEPEPMDLPDDLQLEDGEDKEEENQEENPFDIDEMKDKFPETVPEEQEKLPEENKEDDQKENSENDDGSDREEERGTSERLDEQEDENDSEKKDMEQHDKEESTENITSDGLDQNNSKTEEEPQPMDVDNNEAQSDDKVTSKDAKGQSNQDTTDTTEQENKNDSEGQGQCQDDRSKGGHRDISVSQQRSNTKEERNTENTKRMGESDSSRSLGDTTMPVKKKLKTIHADNKPDDDEEKHADEENKSSDMYQHIKESNKYRDQVLDAATKEQVEEQKAVHDDKEGDNKEDNPQPSDDVPESMDDDADEVNVSEMAQEMSENTPKEKEPLQKKIHHPDGKVLQEIENVEVEGDITQTMQVARGHESFFNKNIGDTSTPFMHLPQDDLIHLRQQIQDQLSTWVEPPTSEAAHRTWEEISAVTSSLAYHLAEQLRLVLEPTQASRLKGDFKTGKRINMRKIIPYIASQFRKDKIWLRRTKPAKREYQIVLAIDDSSSMADNHSKELAFESVSLISKALTLLESGELSILSFGENTEVLHRLCDPFTEKSGANLLQKFQFTEKKTYVGQMLNFATEMLNSSVTKSSALNAKLLVIVSDGRGIFSEGETFVLRAIRNARLSNIFTIFIIIDNPENNSSILDIRRVVFKADNSIDVQSYMDTFPFPYYIVLRDINTLPTVLSDALRQWFEMVSSRDN